jgi:hypothetical protein
MSHIDIKPGSAVNTVHVMAKAEKWKTFPSAVFSNVTDFEFVKNFQTRADDIFIAGFPRSGTSRLQEMVWIIANDFDFEKARQFDSDARCPFFE